MNWIDAFKKLAELLKDITCAKFAHMGSESNQEYNPDAIISGGYRIPDILSHTRCLLHKAKQWEYEQEWRLIDLPKDNPDSVTEITKVKMKPTGIYYGHSISSEDKALLHDIALKKGINEYEMYLDYTSDKYEMKYQEMSKN